MDDRLHKRVQSLIALGRESRLWRHGAGFKHYCEYQLFRGIDFVGRNILDIGGGDGKYSLWAAANGAARVVVLEPTADGADVGSTVTSLRMMRDRLGFDCIEIEEKRVQEHRPQVAYDLVLLHYSINHLAEDACISLHHDPDAYATYQSIFRGIHDMMSPGASVIISDCTNASFWYSIGVKNPFAPDIEWFKHQSPETWARLLMTQGFHSPRVLWTYEPKTLMLGRLLLANRLVSYFYTSIFVLRMEK